MSTPLVTLQQARTWLNFPDDQTQDDALLTSLCASASDFFCTLTGRDEIVATSYTERVAGAGSHVLVPSNLPIISVQSLAIDGINILAQQALATGGLSPGYFFDANKITLQGGGASFPWAPGGLPGIFPSRSGSVQLTYTAGYATVPMDVQQAVWELVGWAYKQKDRIGLNSQGTGQIGVTNSFSQAPLSPMARETVKNYRRKIVGW